jgi:protein ImuB
VTSGRCAPGKGADDNQWSLLCKEIVVVTTSHQRRQVIDLSPAAAATGVRIGLSLAEARVSCSQLAVLDHDPAGDAKALEALGRWMTRFTPVVATGWDEEREEGDFNRKRRPVKRKKSSGEVKCLSIVRSRGLPVEDSPLQRTITQPPVLFLDLTGCDRLAGGIAGIVKDIASSLRRFGVPAMLALAPTPGAAWAMASLPLPGGERAGLRGETTHGDRRGFVRVRTINACQPDRAILRTASPSSPLRGEGAIHRAIAGISVNGLRLSDDTLAILHHLGLRTIGQLLAMPREELNDRLGPSVVLRLDQALGRRPELLVPLPYEPPIETKVDFDAAIESLEMIWYVLRKLLDRIVAELHRRGRGARQIDLTCKPSYSAWTGCKLTHKTVKLSRPSRDPVQIFNLLRCATENLEAGEGFWAMKLAVPVHEAVSPEQIALLQGEEYAGQIELNRLVERLCVRIGEPAIVQPQSQDSYVPERGWRLSPYHGPPARAGGVQTSKAVRFTFPRGSRTGQRPVVQTRSLEHVLDPPMVQSPRTRPMHLLPTPVEIRVIAEPSDESEGRPSQFTHEGRVHRVTHAVGPERIAGEWWRGHYKTRDYYDVEDATGERFWIFRVIRREPCEGGERLSARWYVHGWFE